MKKIRNKTFETNSSSTHSLSYCGNVNLDTYTPVGDKIVIDFINTDDGGTFTTLKRKVSYLVSHIVNNYKYNCLDYEDLVEQVSNSYDFKRISNYVKNKYGKEVVFPKEYKGDIEEIVYINHQLLERDLDSVLEDLITEERDYLAEVLDPTQVIELGHD
jgi:hypothetical protein